MVKRNKGKSQKARRSKKLTGQCLTVQPIEELAGVPLTENQEKPEREIKETEIPTREPSRELHGPERRDRSRSRERERSRERRSSRRARREVRSSPSHQRQDEYEYDRARSIEYRSGNRERRRRRPRYSEREVE